MADAPTARLGEVAALAAAAARRYPEHDLAAYDEDIDDALDAMRVMGRGLTEKETTSV